jgi:hypothetical protein
MAILICTAGWPLLAGCTSIAWEYDYNRAARKAAANNQVMFIYFRDWLNPDSARMENQVLRRPESERLLQDMVSVFLDMRIYEDVAKKYAIGRAPAFIIAKPNGEPVERYVGMPTLETFLDRVARGKGRAVPATPTRAAPGKVE